MTKYYATDNNEWYPCICVETKDDYTGMSEDWEPRGTVIPEELGDRWRAALAALSALEKEIRKLT